VLFEQFQKGKVRFLIRLFEHEIKISHRLVVVDAEAEGDAVHG